MKKILFVAKANKIIQEMNEALDEEFKVQFCSYNKPTIESMLDFSKPDLILISMIGAMGMDTSVFTMIQSKYPDIPVFTIGDNAETRRIKDFLATEQFQNLVRPIKNEDVVNAINVRLGVVSGSDGSMASGAPIPPRRAQSTAERAAALMDSLNEESQGSAGGVQSAGTPVANTASAAENDTPDDGKKRVLVVDDNAGMLRNIKTILEDTYNISVAPSGVKAMASLGKNKPDVILLDYEMPVVNGKQTLEMIRAEKDYADIPVIFLTGVNDREHIQSVLSLRPSGYLLKPPVKATLVEAIEKALKQ